MTILHGIGLLMLGALVLLGLCWALLRWDKMRIKINEYDERQTIERGNAYKIAFWIGVIYYLVVITFGAMEGGDADLYVLVMLGILIQVIAFSFCCLLTNAELPLSKKPVAAIASDLFLGGWFLFGVFWGDVTLGTKLGDLRSFVWIELICGVSMIFMGLVHVIQLLRNREKE